MADESDLSPESTATETATATAPEPAAPEPAAPEPAAPEAAPQTTQEQWDDIRDVAKQYGLDISHIQDSSDAARYLIEKARQNDAFSRYGQQLAPYYGQFQQFLAQQQRAAQQQQPRQQAPNYFGLPEYDPKWLDWLDKDAAGNIVPKPGAPPDVLHKVMQYQAALRDFNTNFYREPQRYLQPMIRDAVQPLIQQAIQQQFKSYQDHVFSTNFVAQNSGWLYHRDPQGQVIRDPVSGQYAMTPEGQMFVQNIQEARALGIYDVQAAQRFAMEKLELQYYRAQQRQAMATSQRSQQDQQFLQQHNRRPPANHGGSLSPPPGMSQNAELSLADRMRQALHQNGVTDAELLRDER